MSVLTMITRRESNEKTDETRPILYAKILQVLSSRESLTANEIAKRINKNWNRQNTQPRLNELVNKHGLVEIAGKKMDYETMRKVAMYRLIERGK